jgi:hypothetical protein
MYCDRHTRREPQQSRAVAHRRLTRPYYLGLVICYELLAAYLQVYVKN